jgi:hypothetical protein
MATRCPKSTIRAKQQNTAGIPKRVSLLILETTKPYRASYVCFVARGYCARKMPIPSK